MGTLKDFLAERAEQLRAEGPPRVQMRDEWVAAVHRLTGQIRDWLAQADPESSYLAVFEEPYTLREEWIGEYEAPGLVIRLGPVEVLVEPVARIVAGPAAATGMISVQRAYGRVDVTDGLRRFMIFRLEKDPEDRWALIEQGGDRLQPFDQQAFEDAFKSLLE